MKTIHTWLGLLGLGLMAWPAKAQTEGSARLETTLLDYNGSGAKHWTIVWVTTPSGAFIKTLRRQGPSLTSTKWNDHCRTWYNAKGGASGSTAIDGYTSATATSYAGTNSPVILTWDCRDAGNRLVADGDYKFWVQYAEDSGQGPYTTSGLLWTKGPNGVTRTYPNQSPNFSNMRVVWTPAAPPAPPQIATVKLLGDQLVLGGTGPADRSYYVLVTSNPSDPMGAWASLATNNFSSQGSFSYTNQLGVGALGRFYRLQVP